MPEEINTNNINSNEINEQILLNQDEKITETNQLLGATMQQNEERKQLSEAGLITQEAIKEKMNGKPSIYVSTIIDAFLEALSVTLKGERGEVGIQGEKGDTPIKGKDYFTTQEINSIQDYIQSQIRIPKDGYTPIKGKDYFTKEEISEIVSKVKSLIPTPKDGKDAEVDYNAVINEVLFKIKIPKGKDGKDGRSISGKEIAGKLEKLEGEDRLSFNSLKDAPKFKGGGGANYMRELNDVEETKDSFKFSNVEIEKTGSINLIEGQKYKIKGVPLSTTDITNAESIENKETETLDNSETKYPCNKVVKDYADSLVLGLLDYRGGYDASSNEYPTAGGSGTSGAVMKGDMWIINVAGTLGGESIQIGDSIIASVNNPQQTASNWNHLNSNISYVPENVANKETSALDTSTTKYPCNNVVKTALENHTNLEIHAEAGVHGIRRYEDKLEYWNGTRWVEIKASPYKIYGVEIDLTNNNPLTSVSYTDDAIGMTAGSSNWDSIDIYKNIKPCVLKNGVLQYYLDPTDFTKKADGSASDITSGDDGDVMIEIPKMGYSIETEGDTLKIKITDNPNDPNFKYYAHSRDVEGDRENLYIGAYLGWYDGSSKLRSISGKTPTATQTIGTFRTQAQANGAGYDQISFYPLTLLQCLYLIRYKSLDSQTALGRGYVDGNASVTATGRTNALGMYYGEETGKVQMKFAGIEDFWGNLYYWIDGLFINNTWNILTALKSFNNTGSGYTDNGQGATANIEGYMSKPQGGNGTGFVLKEYSGSDSTYFCDYGFLCASRLPSFGGYWSNGSNAGAFQRNINYSASDSSSNIGGRLMYL